MRLRTIAVSSAFLITAGLISPAAAHADTAPATLVVDNGTGAGCSDAAGLGTAAVPFCTIQAAVDVAKAGDTVQVEPGQQYSAGADITTSGTPGAPITIVGDEADTFVSIGGFVATQHLFTVTGASNIVIKSFFGTSTGDAVLVDDSSDVTVENLNIDIFGGSGGGIHVTGDSSQVTIERNAVDVTVGSAIAVDPGSSAAAGPGDVISTNEVLDSAGPGISVQSAPNADVTSNTVQNACHTGIAVTGTSTGASIENNIVQNLVSGSLPIEPTVPCLASTGPAAGVEVDSTAVSGTTENYDIVDPIESGAVPYLWSGTSYGSASALHTGTGQGSADINAASLGSDNGPGWAGPAEHSPAIDSANAAAPGELTTDIAGSVRVDDPLVADTGVGGSAVYDRGAIEYQDQPTLKSYLTVSVNGTPQNQAPAGTPLTFTIVGSDPWGGQLTYVFDFGDGQTATNTTGIATHTYAASGTYQLDITFTSTYGGAFGEGTTFPVTAASTPKADFVATQTSPLTVSADAAASVDPWQVYEYQFEWGDGTGSTTAPGTTAATHTYSRPGTYPVTLQITDSAQDDLTVTLPVTVTGGGSIGRCGQSILPGTVYHGGAAISAVPSAAASCAPASGQLSDISPSTAPSRSSTSAVPDGGSTGLRTGFGQSGAGLLQLSSGLTAPAAGQTGSTRAFAPLGCLADAGSFGLLGQPFGCFAAA